LLLKRTVFEQMIEAYPQTRYTYDFVNRNEDHSNYYALFDPLMMDGKYFPEDYAFCYRWRVLGGKIWLDTKGRLNHEGRHIFKGHGLA
jgi:hypothetical protein